LLEKPEECVKRKDFEGGKKKEREKQERKTFKSVLKSPTGKSMGVGLKLYRRKKKKARGARKGENQKVED